MNSATWLPHGSAAQPSKPLRWRAALPDECFHQTPLLGSLSAEIDDVVTRTYSDVTSILMSI
jgi:hypothetical protein